MDERFKKLLDDQRDKMRLPRGNFLRDDEISSIIKDFQGKAELETEEMAKTAIALLFQQGGTARGCNGNLLIHIFEKDVKLATLRKSLKDCNLNKAERKLARSMSTEIYNICKRLGVSGNLVAKLKRVKPTVELSPDEECWISDFQSLNPDLPSHLLQHIQSTFEKRPAAPQKPNRKTGK